MNNYMEALLQDLQRILEMHRDGSPLHKTLVNLLNRESPNGNAPFSLNRKLRGPGTDDWGC